MIDMDSQWLNEMGLTIHEFASCPHGESPLLWGLRSHVVDQNRFLTWASEHHHLPVLDPQFLMNQWDPKLIEKFSEISSWNAQCFPIYEWNNLLFVACAEPQSWSNKAVCFVLAPLDALESLWSQHHTTSSTHEEAVAGLAALDLPSFESSVDVLPSESASQHESNNDLAIPLKTPVGSTPAVQEKNNPPTDDLNSLDFGDLGGEAPTPPSLVEDKKDHKEKEEDLNTPPPLPDLDFSTLSGVDHKTVAKTEAQESTQTATSAFHGRTTATSTLHVNSTKHATRTVEEPLAEMAFENLSIDDLALEGEKTSAKATKNKSANAAASQTPKTAGNTKKPNSTQEDELDLDLPTLGGLVREQQKPVMPEHTVGNVLEDTPSISQSVSIVRPFSDDYTPLPFVMKSEIKNNPLKPKTGDTNEDSETQTDMTVPSFVPTGQLISSEDLNASRDIQNCSDLKSVIAHMFLHLKNDYKKLMWVQVRPDGQFYPHYVYGSWHMNRDAWNKAVNITVPNIFRIAHLSNLPFHGEVSDNPFNDSYFELWNRKNKPDFVTIYPAYYDDISYGFIVGFGMNSDFDALSSLKKIENLLSICKMKFIDSQQKMAS